MLFLFVHNHAGKHLKCYVFSGGGADIYTALQKLNQQEVSEDEIAEKYNELVLRM